MTLPSTILRAMEKTLTERLGEAVEEVRYHDGDPGENPKATVKGKSPLVLVTCFGAPIRPTDGRGIADGIFVAFVLVRNKDTDVDGKISAGLAAANIAATVAGIVENESWGGLMYGRSEGIRMANEWSEKANYAAGWGIWSVAWSQPFEIKSADVLELHRLGSIHHQLSMGGEQTPDAFATIEFPPESTP